MDREARLIDRIYEAAVANDRWPVLLDAIATAAGARGAIIIAQSPQRTRWTTSPGIERDAADYFAQGWGHDPARTRRLYAELHPGFRAEIELASEAEIARLPVYVEFLSPRGFIGGCGTVLQGTADHVLHVGVEGFATHRAALDALPLLDRLRPHLGRALGLAALLERERTETTVEALRLAGVAAAVVDRTGRLRAANAGFVARLGNQMSETRDGLRFATGFLNERFRAALAAAGRPGARTVRSIAVADERQAVPFVLHLLPIAGAARLLCDADGILLIAADAANAALPDADLLRLLFDLTPAEAALTRRLVDGLTVAEAAQAGGIALETARTHLRRVFAKTGVRRQAELVRLLLGIRQPVAVAHRA